MFQKLAGFLIILALDLYCTVVGVKAYYRPQRSCGQGYVFTRVCDSVQGGCLPQCMLGYHPPPTPGSRTPQSRSPRSRPPGSRPPPPPGSRLQHTVNGRPVRILLECILVKWCNEENTFEFFHVSYFVLNIG